MQIKDRICKNLKYFYKVFFALSVLIKNLILIMQIIGRNLLKSKIFYKSFFA